MRLLSPAPARWISTDNAVDTASGVIRLRALVPNVDGLLKPGMFGQARLAGAGTYQAMLVPDAAVATDQARRMVYVVAADGTVAPKAGAAGSDRRGAAGRPIRADRHRPRHHFRVQRIQQPGMKVQARVGQITAVAAAPAGQPVTRVAPASSATFANSLSVGD